MALDPALDTIIVNKQLTAVGEGTVLTLDQLRTVVAAAHDWPPSAVVTYPINHRASNQTIEIRHAAQVDVL